MNEQQAKQMNGPQVENVTFDAPFTPKRIAEQDIRLNVPIYQRLFVWRAEQIEKLLADMHGVWRDQGAAYHIGVVSVWTRPDGDGEWELVDGQQRLTFLSLFAAWAVSDLPQDSMACGEWRRFLLSAEGKPGLRLRFDGRPEDVNDLRAMSERKTPSSGAFRAFADTIAVFMKDKKDIRESFAHFVYEKCAFLADMLPEGFGPHELNLHFEKMNSTGRQLEPIDVVKGLYFSDGDLPDRWNKVFRATGAGRQAKTSIESIISGDGPAAQGGVERQSGIEADWTSETQRIVSDETLLLHALNIASGCHPAASLDKSRLVETFALFMGRAANQVSALAVVEALEKYASWMDGHVVRVERDESGGNKYVLASAATDKTAAGEAEADENPDTGDRKKLKQFESMLHVSTDDTQRWVLDAYKACGNNGAVGAGELLATLKKQDAGRHAFPGKDAASKWRYPAIDRYWFWRLDYLLWERHEDDKEDSLFAQFSREDHEAISDYVFRRDRSIEHLHPQNPPGEAETDKWKSDRKEHGDDVRNGFGNLAMISSSFNSSQGNDSIATKMGRISDQVLEKRLQSIKLLLMVRSVGSNPQGWTPDHARKHGEKMLDLLDCLHKEQASKI